MPGGTTERYRPETQGRRGNGNGASPAWAPARASRLLTGAGRGVRPCRDRLAERDSRMRQVASTRCRLECHFAPSRNRAAWRTFSPSAGIDLCGGSHVPFMGNRAGKRC